MNAIGAWSRAAGTAVGLAVGQTLFKIGARRLNAQVHSTVLSWINGPIVAAVAVYGVSTLL